MPHFKPDPCRSPTRSLHLEPVTTALVLAGIIFLLSTRINIEYENQDGKKTLKVKVEKPKTSEKLLEKFFPLFGNTSNPLMREKDPDQ
jgi:hypothetical protein